MIKQFLACTAAAGLALSPLAAQANTRPADSSVSLAATTNAPARIGASVSESDEIFERISPFLVALIVGGVIVAIFEIADSEGIFD